MPDPEKNMIAIVYGGSLGSFLHDQNQKTSLATVYSIGALRDFLRTNWGYDSCVHVISDSEYNSFHQRFPNCNTILLGGEISLKSKELLAVLTKQFGCSQVAEGNTVKLVSKPTSTSPSSCETAPQSGFACVSVRQNDNVVTDYGLLTLAVKPSGGRRFYWFSGNFGLATYGAVIAATQNRDNIEYKVPHEGRYIQAVIEVYSIENNEIPLTHESINMVTVQRGVLTSDFNF